MTTRFTIDRLGSQGDGIAETERGPLFIQFTLPGETVTAARDGARAGLVAVLEASPERVEPPCRHFGDCGGCALQHWNEDRYRAWKRDLVATALKGRGFDAAIISDLVPCLPQSRRRVTFASRKTEAGVVLGYYRALSATIVDIEECPIARASIVAAVPRLKGLVEALPATPKPIRIAVTDTEAGLDVAMSEVPKLTDPVRRALADLVARAGFARLSVDGEIVIEPKAPIVRFGGAHVKLPPGAFLQAVCEAEEAMAGLVAAHVGKAKRVADLYSGTGTFALRLAARAEIHAVESSAAALEALDRGFRFAPGLRRVMTERRDLDRRPLTSKELAAFDAVVFDPPRAGAEEQAKQIARPDVPLVAAVSCNPGTLARDLRILVDGGYALKRVTPIDQFLWSPHVEAVALLEKPRRRR